MKRKIKYTNELLGNLKVIKDFLPPPNKLIVKEEPVKVTMVLSKSSVQFFKKTAKYLGVVSDCRWYIGHRSFWRHFDTW